MIRGAIQGVQFVSMGNITLYNLNTSGGLICHSLTLPSSSIVCSFREVTGTGYARQNAVKINFGEYWTDTKTQPDTSDATEKAALDKSSKQTIVMYGGMIRKNGQKRGRKK